MIRFMRHVLITVALLLGLACSTTAQQSSSGPGGSEAAAKLGNRTITMKEVEDKWKQASPGEHAQALQQLYDGRKQALDNMIADILIEQAAKAKGQTSEQFLQAEVGRRIKPVTDAEVVAFFNENQSQMQGRALADVGPAIRRYLDDQQRTGAQQAVVAE